MCVASRITGGRDAGRKCFLPPDCAKAPLIARIQSGKIILGDWRAEVVAAPWENSRNSSVIRTQTTCIPRSPGTASQHPLRVKPVTGSSLQDWSGPPRTFLPREGFDGGT